MKKTICVLLTILLVLMFVPTVAFAADTYAANVVTIDTAPGASLEASITAVRGGDPASAILGLTIEDGVTYTLTTADIDYIDSALTGMTDLYIGTGTSFNYNGVSGNVGDGFLQNHAAIQDISLANAETFGTSAFDNCNFLNSVSLPVAETFGDDAFRNCGALANISLPLATTFGISVFYDCNVLTTVSLPLAETFGDWAFESTDALTTISLPSATTFGDGAFDSCYLLATISLPLATTFGNYAFRDCSVLATVSLPLATTFGDDAFLDCAGPVTLWLGSSIPTADANTFNTFPTDTNSIANVPEADVAAYLAVADGDTGDGLWWGWTIAAAPVTNPATGDGANFNWFLILAGAMVVLLSLIVGVKFSLRKASN